MEKALVLNIQRFSPHDGDGIRTTIFFKGCGLHCLWCHNPESQNYKREIMIFEERCRKCGFCIKNCSNSAMSFLDGKLSIDRDRCQACGDCVEECAYSALELAGNHYSVGELLEEARRDMIIYDESGGGVTLSGGEVMSQDIDFLLELCQGLDRLGIRVNIDTCGLAPSESYERIAPYVDTFLYDIKTIDREKHLEYIGGGMEVILNNLILLNGLGAKINIRLPIIGGVNDSPGDIKLIIDWLDGERIKVGQVNLLPYHNTGSGKYERLGKEYRGQKLKVPGESDMEVLKKLFIDAGYDRVFIGG